MPRAFSAAPMLRAVAPGTTAATAVNAVQLANHRRAVTMEPMERHARIRWMVDEHIVFVTRTLQKAGVPPADLDDEVQRTFIIAARRIDDVQPGAERAFLFQVAVNLAWHARRSLARRREILGEEAPEPIETRAAPDELIERMQIRRHLDGIVDRMDDSLRSVFTLFAIDEMNLNEIAVYLSIPRGTVASRLRRARAQLRKHVGSIELAWTHGAKDVKQSDEPVSIWHKKLGTVERALLRAGAWLPTWPSTRTKTLSVLGLA